MIDSLQHDLVSALYKLSNRFRDDPEFLHSAVALVFSSIFKYYSIPCTIVGGQSAAYWMRLPGSTDVDFVSEATDKIADTLERCDFKKNSGSAFRYNHPATNVQIELVGETIKIGDIKTPGLTNIEPCDIEDPFIRSLMPGPAETLDPVLTFINYIEASCSDSIWFSLENEGALAIERSQALLALYKDYIVEGMRNRAELGEIPEKIIWLLRERFDISL